MKEGSLVELKKECADDISLINLQKWGNIIPQIDNIYVVRELEEVPRYDDFPPCMALRLEEIRNAPQCYLTGWVECSFKVELFNELQPPMEIGMLLEVECHV